MRAVYPLSTYNWLASRQGRSDGIFGDIAVTYSVQGHADENWAYYPKDGFRLSSVFASFGGLENQKRLCQECVANTIPGGLGGCAGVLLPWDIGTELHEQFDDSIKRLGLRDRLDSMFPKTGFHWHRFWIESPAAKEAIPVMRSLFSGMLEDMIANRKKDGLRLDHDWLEYLAKFVEALRRAEAENLDLHLEFTPPGHTDGGYTIFCHCPRCKYEAPVERWRRKYSDVPVTCRMCGHSYSPAATHSFEEMKVEFGEEQLRRALGQQEYESFAKEFLESQGVSPERAVEIVRSREAKEQERIADQEVQNKESQRNRAFVVEVLFKGLSNQCPDDPQGGWWQFSAKDMVELLKRCETHSARVFYIDRICECQDDDKQVIIGKEEGLTKPLEVFDTLWRTISSDRFETNIRVPKETVDRWWETRSSTLS